MVKLVLLALVSAGLALLPEAPVHAIAIEFQPADTTVGVGATFDVDVVVSGLEDGIDEIVSSFDLSVIFDAAVVAATNVTFGALLGDPLSIQGDLLGPGRATFSELSLLSDAALAALQPDSFTLATLTFEALAPGFTTLEFDPVTAPGILLVGRDAAVLQLESVGAGSVTVVAVSEPHGLLLLAMGLLSIAAVRPRYRRQLLI